MSDGDALLAALMAFPDEDTPRLIYADWLEESGDALMAQFIRIQIEMANKGFDPVLVEVIPSLWPIISKRIEDELPVRKTEQTDQTRGINYWIKLQPWRATAGRDIVHPKVILARGFIDSVVCSATDWTEVAEAILARHPVRKVKLTTQPQLRFGNVGYRDFENEKAYGGKLMHSARWTVTDDIGKEIDARYDSAISRDELFAASRGRDAVNIATRINSFNYAGQAARTPLAYLRMRWAQVTAWEMPSEYDPNLFYMSRVSDQNDSSYTPFTAPEPGEQSPSDAP